MLKTLAQFAPARPAAPPSIEQTLPASTPGDELPEEGEYEPADAMLLDIPPPDRSGTSSTPVATESTRKSTTASSHMPSKRPMLVDPSTIIDWPSGLRCVMKTVARSDAIMARIKKVRDLDVVIV